MKTALVLEGGAMRGIYTAGVIDVLLENNIKVDGIIGVSAGAIYGINYGSKQIGRAIRYNKKYLKYRNYMSFYSLLTTGNLVNKDFCYYKLANELDKFDYDEFNKSNLDFHVVITNLETGKPEYHKITDIENEIEYIRASSSMPLVTKNVYLDEKPYLDGGISDSIPIQKAIDLGYEKIIVVLTRPIEYQKEPLNIKPYKLMYKKYPNFLKSLEKRHIMYNNEINKIKELEKDNKILVIRPSKDLKIKRLEKNLKKVENMYQLGKDDCINKLNEITYYLK